MNKHILATLLLAVIMIALPIHLRYSQENTTLPGSEPYYHKRMAQTLGSDDAIVNGRTYLPNPYHYVLAAAYALFGTLAFLITPALFALLSVLLFYLILCKLHVPKYIQPWILLVYSLSPPLIASGTIGTPHAFVLFSLLAGTTLLFTRAWMASIIFFLLASTTGALYSLAAFVTILFLFFINKTPRKRLLVPIIIVSLVAIFRYYPSTISIERSFVHYLSDIGGIYGFSLFAFLLALVGATIIWKHKSTYYTTYVLLFALLIASFFFPRLLIFGNVIICALAGVALATLAKRHWHLTFLRQATLLVLFCGLLFSSISHAGAIADLPPTPKFFTALNITPGVVLTHETYGFWVEDAGHTTIIDPLWQELPEADSQHWDAYTLFSSTNVEDILFLLGKYNTTYILITPEMKHGLVWDREEQGLSFIVEYNENFKKIETESSLEVWQTP